ncbi:mycothiol-dependent maleylpyruvate isomerase NagL [Gordonia sinesedis]
MPTKTAPPPRPDTGYGPVAFRELPLDSRLAIVRDGTDWLASHLDSLTDADLEDASLLPGWSRRHLLAHLGYNAVALGNLMSWAATGVETPMYSSPEARNREIDYGATLPAEYLRDLFHRTAARLADQWARLPKEGWSVQVRTAQGRNVPAAEAVWMRSREVWIHTVDLNTGATFDDFPGPVVADLFGDVLSAWRRRGAGERLRLRTTDPVLFGLGPADSSAEAGSGFAGLVDVDPQFEGERDSVNGSTAALVGWMCGRSSSGVDMPTGVRAPAWL